MANGKQSGTVETQEHGPFGQPNIDQWLHWHKDDQERIWVRYRGVWYVISHTLYEDWTVERVASKSKKILAQIAALSPVKYQSLPWQFMAETNKWLPKLHRQITGLPDEG